ncbi:MAG: SCP-2 sterol transfer family protein [Gammaproteobacteria bacterium]|nr:SCP-2 sterol transfer family protein [Gammaproteobacteria bacterium]
MSKLFNENWMKRFQSEWNKDINLNNNTETSRWNLTIGYGFPEEGAPRGCIIMKNGHITEAGLYHGQTLDWDLRAKELHWKDWLNREVGSSSIGLAYTTGKLKFLSGDYWQIVKNPTIKKSFIKGFSVMGRL